MGTMDSQLTLHASAMLGGGATLLSARGTHPWLATFLVVAGAAMAGVHLLKRFHFAWPFLPMYVVTEQVAFLLGILWAAWFGLRRISCPRQLTFIALAMSSLTLSGAFFPKDYYLPDIRTATPWAHLFSWADATARALFIGASSEGAALLLLSKQRPSNRYHPLAAAGLCLSSFAIVSGIFWSINTQGVPVSFSQPETLEFMLIWFLWLLVCHCAHTKIRNDFYWLLVASAGLITLFITIRSCFGIWRPF